MRDHSPVIIEKFNGIYNRGNVDSVPLDHFSDAENLQFSSLAIKTRDGLDTFLALSNPLRIYNYITQDGESLLVLVEGGNLYHVLLDGSETATLILTIVGMSDFTFTPISGYAYISPFATFTDAQGRNYQKGLEDEFVYVYLGDNNPARKIAGDGPTAGSLTLANGAAGEVEAGIHIIGVVYETNTGFLTEIGRLTEYTAPGGLKINVSNIPVSPDSFVIARRLVASVAIDPLLYTGNLEGYQLFFVPDGRIDNNTATTLTIDFYDADLFSDASHLLDILSEVPAVANLTTYHGRMVASASFEDISLQRISYAGEQEAFDAVSGLVIIPLDGNPITCAQEFRDVLYTFKKTRTYAVTDNGDVPSSWPVVVMDQGIGASVHGVGTVLDSGGVNIDYLLIVDYSGLMQFNGAYQRPELSWKIETLWFDLDRNDFGNIQIMNDSLSQIIYITLPDRQMYMADYKNGLNAKDIRWMKWRFDIETTTIALIDTNTLIIGSNALV